MTGKRGFTLVEVIMVTSITAILAAIAVPMLNEVVNAWSFTSRFQSNAVNQAIVAANRMSREIRRLKNDTSVTTANSGQFSFNDIDSTALTYNQSGTLLMRNSDALADIDSVNALAFTYLDDNDAVIATPVVSPNNTDIRSIQARFYVLAGSNKVLFQITTRPQNLRRLNEKFK